MSEPTLAEEVAKPKWEKFDAFTKFLAERKHVNRVFSATKVKNAHYANGVRDCKRKLVYALLGTKEIPMDINGRFVTGLGDGAQELVKREFVGAKIYETEEETIGYQDPRLKMPFSMRIDMLVTLPPDLDADQKLRPVEVKSMAPNQYYDVEYKSWGDKPPLRFDGAWSVPKDYHLDQINLYLTLMKVDWGMLFILDRAAGHYTVYKVFQDQERYDECVAHCLDVEKSFEVAKETGLMPARINDTLPLGVYKRDTENNKIGDVKLDKGAFPCIWKNKDSGKYGMCQFFETCHKQTLDSLNLTMESFK